MELITLYLLACRTGWGWRWGGGGSNRGLVGCLLMCTGDILRALITSLCLLMISSVQFSSRWYLCSRKSPYIMRSTPSLRIFPSVDHQKKTRESLTTLESQQPERTLPERFCVHGTLEHLLQSCPFFEEQENMNPWL